MRPGGRGLGLGRPRRDRGDQRARRRRPGATRPSSSAGRGRSLRGARRRLRPPRRHRHPARRRASAGACCPSPPTRAAARRGRSSASRRTAPTTSAPARLGATRAVITQDAYGRGPVQRSIVTLRGTVRPGNSGGPLVDARGRVVATVFAADAQRPAAAATACPNAVVERDLEPGRRRHGVHRALRRLSYPAASMAKTLVIAEKPSVGQDLARVLPGPFEKHTGAGDKTARWLEGPEHVITLGRRPPRPARRARRVRRQVQEVADGRPADRPAQLQARRARRALREADEGRARPAAPRRRRPASSTPATPGARAS